MIEDLIHYLLECDVRCFKVESRWATGSKRLYVVTVDVTLAQTVVEILAKIEKIYEENGVSTEGVHSTITRSGELQVTMDEA